MWGFFDPITGKTLQLFASSPCCRLPSFQLCSVEDPASFFRGKATHVILSCLIFLHFNWAMCLDLRQAGSYFCGFLIPLLAGKVPAAVFIWWWQCFEYPLLTKMRGGLCKTFLDHSLGSAFRRLLISSMRNGIANVKKIKFSGWIVSWGFFSSTPQW